MTFEVEERLSRWVFWFVFVNEDVSKELSRLRCELGTITRIARQ